MLGRLGTTYVLINQEIIEEGNLATLLLQFSDQENGQNLVKIVKYFWCSKQIAVQ